MKKILYILLAFTALNSCSEYQKVLKAEEIAPKFKMGEELYNAGKYEKANRLFAQIVPNYRGKPQAEKLMYLYSNSFYRMRDYYVAGYQFERFASSYPESEKLEEASFLSAKSYYMLSPVYSKDQTDTVEAIEKLQNFINLFPESEYLDEANKLVKELEFKLEQKAFSIAMKYAEIAPGYTFDFDAAIKSFDNFIYEFPGSVLREDAMYFRLDAVYQQAMNSYETRRTVQGNVEHIKKLRLEKGKEYSSAFKNSFPNSKYIEEVNRMAIDIDNELKQYQTES
ncbi:outer membrane protein assembly factor BamD [Aestuariivivens sp. NBU2969]|uniref:outer membrane protein assembly factor BamD n=1 Tax=Aestuariivivens sp. NBU2969 TaxID=2873267 RepID=UPI001CC0F9ED|nr:outer membrane protein assembly factor BamD [Aestuariivivens sp. NBU2969]